MNSTTPIILASKSPRRQALLRDSGIPFEVKTTEVNETWPSALAVQDVPEYLAKRKADALSPQVSQDIILAADTVVILENKLLGKPRNEREAAAMLQRLSAKKHQVITGVCMQNQEKHIRFKDVTQVTFKALTPQEIEYYVHTYRPLDKAGAYGIQEWLGLIAVTEIAGSFYNVMGLPVHRIYQELLDW